MFKCQLELNHFSSVEFTSAFRPFFCGHSSRLRKLPHFCKPSTSPARGIEFHRLTNSLHMRRSPFSVCPPEKSFESSGHLLKYFPVETAALLSISITELVYYTSCRSVGSHCISLFTRALEQGAVELVIETAKRRPFVNSLEFFLSINRSCRH